MPRRLQPDGNLVVTQEFAVDLTATAGDKALTMVCPADGATVREWYVKVDTAGVGAGANHELILEHGIGAAGVALTPQLDLDADAAAETIVSGPGLQPPSISTVGGTALQILNAESASITTGAIVDISVTWQL